MSPREEAVAILDLVKGDAAAAIGILQHQLDVVYARAQVLTGLAGIVVTVTGFSGRLIASTHRPAQVLVILGLATVIIAAFVVVRRVMRIRWVTSTLGPDPVRTMESTIVLRDAKTAALHTGGVILFWGLGFYALAMTMMLLNPVPVGVPVR